MAVFLVSGFKSVIILIKGGLKIFFPFLSFVLTRLSAKLYISSFNVVKYLMKKQS